MCGARIEPWRALPVPFCLKGLRPAPETSPRRLVEWVPWRAAARCATTTWWISGMFVLTSKSAAGSSTEPAFLPSAPRTSSARVESAICSGPLHCVADVDDAATSTGDGALDEQQTLLGVDGVHREVEDGHALATHTAGHAHALEDAARGRRCADRAGLAVVAVRTVRCRDALEVVTLHDTGEALALAGADDVDQLAGLERALSGELLAERVVRGIRRAHLGEVATRGHAGGLEMGRLRLVDLARVDLAVGDLDRVVAVTLGRANLGDHVRRELDDGDGNELAVLVPYLGHAELGAQHPLRNFGVDVCHGES